MKAVKRYVNNRGRERRKYERRRRSCALIRRTLLIRFRLWGWNVILHIGGVFLCFFPALFRRNV